MKKRRMTQKTGCQTYRMAPFCFITQKNLILKPNRDTTKKIFYNSFISIVQSNAWNFQAYVEWDHIADDKSRFGRKLNPQSSEMIWMNSVSLWVTVQIWNKKKILNSTF